MFITPTKALVNQQVEYIRRHFDYETDSVQGYTGDTWSGARHVDVWEESDWTAQRELHRVFVMTPEIMRNLLSTKLISMDVIDTVVADECHHATGKHAMAEVFRLMKEFSPTRWPKVLGLTATPKKTKRVRRIYVSHVKYFDLRSDSLGRLYGCFEGIRDPHGMSSECQIFPLSRRKKYNVL